MSDFDVMDDYSVRRAAGGVVYRMQNGRPEVVIVHRKKYNDWQIPKGKCAPDETLEHAALREIFEETGLNCSLIRLLCSRTFTSRTGHPRTAHYWLMERVAGVLDPVLKDEIDRAKWVSLGEGVKLLTSDRDKVILYELMVTKEYDR